jgi:hypothetical protein
MRRRTTRSTRTVFAGSVEVANMTMMMTTPMRLL